MIGFSERGWIERQANLVRFAMDAWKDSDDRTAEALDIRLRILGRDVAQHITQVLPSHDGPATEDDAVRHYLCRVLAYGASFALVRDGGYCAMNIVQSVCDGATDGELEAELAEDDES